MYDVLFHVICLLESSLGQGNYNWCPGTHSSLCLRTSLTDKQVLVGDLPCECLFHEGCNENTHKHIFIHLSRDEHIFIHLSRDEHLGYFHMFAIVNDAAVNMDVKIFL